MASPKRCTDAELKQRRGERTRLSQVKKWAEMSEQEKKAERDALALHQQRWLASKTPKERELYLAERELHLASKRINAKERWNNLNEQEMKTLQDAAAVRKRK